MKMNKVPHLYLDMDGVQCDFFTQWAKWHGIKNKVPEIEQYKQIGDRKQREESIKQMQAEGPDFVYKFFSTLPELGGGMRLLHWIVQNKIPCTVLTAPLRNPPGDTTNAIRDASIAGKKYWLEHHNPHFPVIFESNKYKYAVTDGTPNVLVDDFKEYVNAWRDHGGIAVLHRNNTTDDTISKLEEIYAPYLKRSANKSINTSNAVTENTMNSNEIYDYLEEAAQGPQPGDYFELILNDMVLETYVVAVDGDDVLIEGDARACAMLLESALQFKQQLDEAKYQGRTVPLGKPMQGDVKKSKVYVRKPNGKVVKVNFGAKGMKIKKSNPKRRKSFRARHNCQNPGPRWKAKYWSCRAW